MAASCRRGRNGAVSRKSTLAALAILATSSIPARASDLPASFCPLAREPALNWLRPAEGDDCARDEDNNGLDDEVESELAACFVPEVRFDSLENALRVDEPHVMFSASPLGARSIRLHFAFLFAKDGGYVLGTQFPCLSDEHDGDVESVTVDVAWTDRNGGWFGVPASMRIRDPRDGAERIAAATQGPQALQLSATHPVLYATAGKHHWLFRPEFLSYACSCGPLGRCGSVQDRADGVGAHIVPPLVDHAPGFYVERTRVTSQTPIDPESGSFWNACSLAARGAHVRAKRLFASNDLGELGYSGERVFGACFRGGFGGPCAETISVAEALAWDKPFANRFGARKLVTVLLGAPADPEPTRTTVLLPFGAAPQSLWRY
jgi:hypothetical protein